MKSPPAGRIHYIRDCGSVDFVPLPALCNLGPGEDSRGHYNRVVTAPMAASLAILVRLPLIDILFQVIKSSSHPFQTFRAFESASVFSSDQKRKCMFLTAHRLPPLVRIIHVPTTPTIHHVNPIGGSLEARREGPIETGRLLPNIADRLALTCGGVSEQVDTCESVDEK